jgi:tricorn protease-like protein
MVIEGEFLMIRTVILWLLSSTSWAVTTTKGEAWLRLSSNIEQSKIDKKGQYLAYVDKLGTALRVVNLKTGDVYLAAKDYVGSSFFWAPDNKRLIYTKLTKSSKGVITTHLIGFDMGNRKNIEIEKITGQSGLVSFDPRDNKFFLMHEKGVMAKAIQMPDSRLARWQARIHGVKGRFVATRNGMTYLTQNGAKLTKLEDDNSGIESFDISADGSAVVWSTNLGQVYTSKLGGGPQFIDYGRDPKWHPTRQLIVYSGAHMVGRKVSGYDIKISNLAGENSWLTNDSYLNQRWPVWVPGQNKVIYTKADTSDLYMLEFKK